MTFIEEKIRITLEKLGALTVTSRAKADDVYFIRCGYKTSNVPPEDGVGWTRLDGKPVEFERDSHAWLHFALDVPKAADNEKYFLNFTTGKEGQWDAQNPQCTVFVNGTTAIQAFDTNHTELLLDAGKKDIYIYLFAGMANCTLFLNVSLIKKNMDVNKLYYDMSVPYEAMKCLDKNSYDYVNICNCLDRACMLIDFRDNLSEAFYDSVLEADRFLEEEFYGKLCGKGGSGGELALIGHTHIDVAWLWTLAQTAEKAQRSFSTVINLMEQYPDYVFMSSQPQLYKYVKQNDPELYERIKKRIKEGRFEPEGAMWLESDTNLVSGESLIRQIMYGKKFMKDEFGTDSRVLWLPDVFGYSAALPQILKKCGVDKFFTAKISWSETNKFPHDAFIWRGIDGSEVFAVLSDSYVKRLEPGFVFSSEKVHTGKKYSDTHIMTFGFGDGGGGPTYQMLENYERLKRGLPGFPKVTMKKSAEALEDIHDKFIKSTEQLRFTPKWSGELYLEMHRGTYTTMAANKKNNRKSELLYQKAEAASASALLLSGEEYPKEALAEGWETILKNQFHDILPGSSIKEVYDVSSAEYEKVLEIGEKVYSTAIDEISKNIKTKGGVLVYNPTPFEVTDTVRCGDVEFIAEKVPSHGYAVIDPSKNTLRGTAKQVISSVLDRDAKAFDKIIENEYLKVTFDEKYHIISIYDKKNGREVIEGGKSANVLEVFEDYPRAYDAWEITEYYKQKKWTADDVSEVFVINEQCHAGLSIKRRYGRSVIKQDIILKTGSPRLDFVTEIDWHEDHVLLKAAFPFDIHAESAAYDIQFGYVTRPTHRNTSWDEAKFEVCAHKWADISEADYGVSLMSDCKYGYSTEENVMKISLLKAPTYPNPEADRGLHTFTYSVYPHSGTVSQGGTIKQAYMLNDPLCAAVIPENKGGTLSERFCFVRSDKEGAVVETIKLAEDGNGFIVRIYEALNSKIPLKLTFGFDIEKVFECDMLENDLEQLESDGRDVKLRLSNFEIKTLRVIPAKG